MRPKPLNWNRAGGRVGCRFHIYVLKHYTKLAGHHRLIHLYYLLQHNSSDTHQKATKNVHWHVCDWPTLHDGTPTVSIFTNQRQSVTIHLHFHDNWHLRPAGDGLMWAEKLRAETVVSEWAQCFAAADPFKEPWLYDRSAARVKWPTVGCLVIWWGHSEWLLLDTNVGNNSLKLNRKLNVAHIPVK